MSEYRMHAELIYNPFCGQTILRRELKDVADFLGRYGWAVSVKETSKPREATDLARDAVRRGMEIVIAAGGDGTINEITNGLVDSDTALGVLPVGTTNVWALQMGIPVLNPMLSNPGAHRLITDFEERIAHPLPANYHRRVLMHAAKVLVEGRTVTVDVGEISDRFFLLWAGIGLDAAVVESITAKEKRTLGSWAYFLRTLGAVRRFSSTEVTLDLDGEIRKISTPLIIVSNIQLYGGMLAIGARAIINDGKLDVCVFKGDGFFTFVEHGVKLLSRQHLRNPKIDYYQCSRVAIEAARSLPVHVDGEPFARTPVNIRIKPLALKVIIPMNTNIGMRG